MTTRGRAGLEQIDAEAQVIRRGLLQLAAFVTARFDDYEERIAAAYALRENEVRELRLRLDGHERRIRELERGRP